jgi:small subunit ribosomal protein S27Ae
MADEKQEGKPVKLKKTSKRYENYEVSGSTVKRKNKSCPKCGPGVFLAKHKDRITCGNCGYVEVVGSE